MKPTPVKVEKTFISYSSRDEEFARKLAADLLKVGTNIWFDKFDLCTGANWPKAVEEALKSCGRFLLVLSPASVELPPTSGESPPTSENVLAELNFALTERKAVFPVLYKKCRPPFLIGAVQYADFTENYAFGLSRLLRDLGVERADDPVPKLAARGRGLLYGALLAGLVLGTTIGASYGLVRSKQPPPVTVKVKVNPIDNLRYVWIPAGSFMMGCSVQGPCNPLEDSYSVRLRDFRIGETQVTQEAYIRVTADSNPSTSRDPKNPVEQVTWENARRYCRKIGGRLPTDEEWEYAARAGTLGRQYANNSGNAGRPHPVGQNKNAWGLYDMPASVMEWTQDVPLITAQQKEQMFIVLRGGPDESIGRRLLSEGASYVGFRCAWDEP